MACCMGLFVWATDNLHRTTATKTRGIDSEKTVGMGSEIDFYVELSPVKKLTLFLGEELYLDNFLTLPDANLFSASYTSVGAVYKPHKNVSLTAAYEFQYLYGGEMRHRAKLMIMPHVSFGDFTLSLRERAHMTYSMNDESIDWSLRSRLRLDYAIPSTPLSVYAYAEMYNPLACNPVHWFDMIAFGGGVDWAITNHHILGLYYEYDYSIDSHYHLLGVAYVITL